MVENFPVASTSCPTMLDVVPVNSARDLSPDQPSRLQLVRLAAQRYSVFLAPCGLTRYSVVAPALRAVPPLTTVDAEYSASVQPAPIAFSGPPECVVPVVDPDGDWLAVLDAAGPAAWVPADAHPPTAKTAST